MKANEAPEKIYMPNELLSEEWQRHIEGEDTEYIRADAFIEKACELLVNCIEDFMLRRMEIWDEECKKQTLENLRKALNE